MTTGTNNWCTIESDPGVFTELIGRIGARDLQVEEVYSMDEAVFSPLRPVFGLIFLFKWAPDVARASRQEDASGGTMLGDIPGVFFASQVINNACATQAILSVLLNLPDSVDIGAELRAFRDFTRDFPPEMRGLAIGNSESIRAAHNSFARPEAFVTDEKKRPAKDDDDVYHFITYVPVSGSVYEIDGLQPGPVHLGRSGDDWLDVARPAIQRRIERYSQGEIRFSLMAVVRNRKTVLEEQIAKARESGAEAEVARLSGLVAQEEEKLAAWHAENVRRRHNYIPFIANLLRTLAETGNLEPLLKKATERAKEEKERKQKEPKKPTGGAPEPMQE